MKSTKRVLALGMASVMTLGLLTACGSKNSGDADSGKDAQDQYNIDDLISHINSPCI